MGRLRGVEMGGFGQDVLYERIINKKFEDQTNRQNDKLGIF